MKRTFLCFMCALGTFVLTGCHLCGTSDPSEKQARTVFTHSLQPLINDGGEMIDFSKTNGELKVIDGQKCFLYHYHAAIRLPSGLAWHSTNGSMSSMMDSGGFEKYSGQSNNYWTGTYSLLPAGTTAAFIGVIIFRPTEEGWISGGILHDAQQGYCANQTPSGCYKQFGWNVLR